MKPDDRDLDVVTVEHTVLVSIFFKEKKRTPTMLLPPSQISGCFNIFLATFDHSSYLKNLCKYKK